MRHLRPWQMALVAVLALSVGASLVWGFAEEALPPFDPGGFYDDEFEDDEE